MEGCVRLYTCGGKEGSDAKIARCIRDYCAREGVVAPEIAIVRERGKKPRAFGGAPEFSVTHSAGVWMAAVARVPVGLDLQERRRCDMRGIARRFFHPEEYAFLESCGYSAFFELWAAKESYVKYTGTGIADGFGEFSVVSGGGLKTEMAGARLLHLPCEAGALCLCAPCEVRTERLGI